MKKLTLVLAVALALAIGGIVYLWPSPVLPQTCVVTGDVIDEIVLGDLSEDVFSKVPQGGKGLTLVNLVELAKPTANEYSILLLSGDECFLQLKGNELEGCYVVRDGGYWNAVVTAHPAGAALKNIVRIVVADDTGGLAGGVNIIAQSENILATTAGNMFRQQVSCYAHFAGDDEKKEEQPVALFHQKRVLPLAGTAKEEIKSVTVMGKGGEFVNLPGAGYLELSGSKINYLSPEGKTIVRNIAGVIINPPLLTVKDAYTDALRYLEDQERVMLVIIDGLGYHQFKEAKEKDLLPNLVALGPAERATTVYKPVAAAGLAAIITGQPPSINGVGDNFATELAMPTIFDLLEEELKSHVYVGGAVPPVKFTGNIKISQSSDGSGTTDADVFGSAMDEILKGPDFLAVHFRGVDDIGHKYGPLAPQTMEALKALDAYIGLMLLEWQGKVIVVAGHGMHSVGGEGSHGNFQYEDMIVPYITN